PGPRALGGPRDLQRCARPLAKLFRIVIEAVRKREPGGRHRLAALLEPEGLALLRGEGLARLFAGLEVDHVVEYHAENHGIRVEPEPAEEPLGRDGAEFRK